MKSFPALTIIAVTIMSINTYGQDLPDTIYFYQVRNEKIMDNLPEIGQSDTLYTLKNPEGYIYKDADDIVFIVIKNKKAWSVWSVFDNSNAWGDIQKIERIDFTNKKKDELIIYWEHRSGRSGWESGFSESWQGFQIWDLETKTRLIELQTDLDYEYWWTQYEEDTTDTIPFEERNIVESGGESSHYQAEVTVSQNKIFIRERVNEQEGEALELCTGEYVLYPNHFIFENKECE